MSDKVQQTDAADDTRCSVCQRESCDDPAHLAQARARRKASRSPLRFRSAAEILRERPPVPIVDGLVWRGQASVITSEPGVGKTFFDLSVGAAVSAGTPWCRRHVQQGSVAYLSFEGDSFQLRLRALQDAGYTLEHVYILRARDTLSPIIDPRERTEMRSRGELDVAAALDELRGDLKKQGKPPVTLLIIDTVRASLAGPEDSSDNISAYLRAARRLLARCPKAGLLLTHHAGWQTSDPEKRRERGSSALRAGVEASFYLEAQDEVPDQGVTSLMLRTLKARDVEKPPPLALLRRQIVLDWDQWRREISSCVIEPDLRSSEDREAEAQAAQEAADQALDRRLLRLIAARPDVATSQAWMQAALNIRKASITASVARLVQRGWLSPPVRQRAPYRLTDEGRRQAADGVEE